MRFRQAVAVAALASVSLLGAGCASSAPQPAPQDAAQPGMPSEEEMSAMMDAATLTDEHTKLAALAGTWDCEMTCGDMSSKSVMTVEPLMGGRVMMSRMQGDMGGMPFEAIELRGYHKEKKDHWSLWVDSMGTLYVASHGTRGADGVVTSKSDEFEYIGKKMSMDMTQKQVDADTIEGTMVMRWEGKPDTTSTMRCVRRKDAAAAPK
jgi:hypothetical protein